MPKPYPAKANQFGKDLLVGFQTVNGLATNRPDEIKKFENLIKSFTNITNLRCFVGNYHGKNSQVTFPAYPVFTRPSPRCELSDLLFLTYSSREMRVSFLQVKSKVKQCPFPVFLANAEQYVVLSQKPIINWSGKEKWNIDVLSNAILSSVGSFGTFIGENGGSVEFCYSSADCLIPFGKKKQKSSGVYISHEFDLTHPILYGRSIQNGRNNFYERTFCFGLEDFGAALYSLEIGTPISFISKLPDSNFSALPELYKVFEWAKQKNLEDPNDQLILNLLDSPHLRSLPERSDNVLLYGRQLGAKHIILLQVKD